MVKTHNYYTCVAAGKNSQNYEIHKYSHRIHKGISQECSGYTEAHHILSDAIEEVPDEKCQAVNHE